MREDRKKLLEEYQGDKPHHLIHPWIDYSRYRYSDQIIATLKNRGEDFNKLIVIDYGCGVADYGMEFGRLGSEVWFYDNPTYLNFVLFRISKEEKQFTHHFLDTDLKPEMPKVNVAIFGEVLEHLENPLEVITEFVKADTKYIFTSSYPFRSDSPNDDYWHHPGHSDLPRQQQSAIRGLLFSKYERIQYNGNASLWVKK